MRYFRIVEWRYGRRNSCKILPLTVIVSGFLQLPDFSEFSRGDAFHFFEDPGKVVSIIKTTICSDFIYGEIGKPKHLFCPGDSSLLKICVYCEPKLFFKNAGHIIFIDIEFVRKLI